MSPRPEGQSRRRSLAVVLVLLLVFAGAGLGTNSSVTEFVRSNGERLLGMFDDDGASTTGEPPVTTPTERTPPGATPTEQPTPGPTATPADGAGPADTATATESTEPVLLWGTLDTRATPSTVDLDLGGTGQTNLFEFRGGAGGEDAVAPGSSGVNGVTLTNNGDRDGVLELSAVTYTSDENGLTEAESEVDDTGGDPGPGAGELHEALEIRVSLVTADGSSRYVIGDETSYRSVASLADGPVALGSLGAGESVAFVVEFRIPATVGNEIQSDTIVVDLEFSLTSAD